MIQQQVMVAITAFYHFVPLSPEQIDAVMAQLTSLGPDLAVRGLVLVAPEGINGTVCMPPDNMPKWKAAVKEIVFGRDVIFKDATADDYVFPRYKVDLRTEIVTADMPGVFPTTTRNNHLTPREWHETILNDPNVVVIDTRNDYEVKIGKFKGAVDPNLDVFTEWPKYVEENPLDKDTKVLMYCTGGIRCEKAIFAMQERGYSNVWQLEGGILKYFEEFPDGGAFEGECFVFDDRIAVTPDLKPTQRWGRCPHCGDPAAVPTECPYCGENAVICDACEVLIANGESHRRACSRNCATHVKRGTTPRIKRKPAEQVTDTTAC
jgi:UPF0176 protein